MQLIGITALMIACKSEEILFPDIEDYVYICDNAYKSGIIALIFFANSETSRMSFNRTLI